MSRAPWSAGLALGQLRLASHDECSTVRSFALIVNGTSGDDVLMGSPSPDFHCQWAVRGRDELHALAGDDTLFGGEGDDVIYGGRGADDMFHVDMGAQERP